MPAALSIDGDLSPAERLARTLDPTLLFADAGLPSPHSEQARVLRNWRRDHLLCWTRQGGKSTTGAVLACHNMLFAPFAPIVPTIVCVARGERQSGELFRKARQIYGRLSYAPPLKTDSATVMEMPDGGRMVAYPGNEESVRGLSAVTLALIDEASLTERELRDAVSPMLSTTGAPIWAMGTARGTSGWFYDMCQDDAEPAIKSMLPWDRVAHLNRDFISRERQRMPAWQFAQEYECIFCDAGESVLIGRESIERAINREERALW